MKPEVPAELVPVIRETPFDEADYSEMSYRLDRSGVLPDRVLDVSIATQLACFNFVDALGADGRSFTEAQVKETWLSDEGARIHNQLQAQA